MKYSSNLFQFHLNKQIPKKQFINIHPNPYQTIQTLQQTKTQTKYTKKKMQQQQGSKQQPQPSQSILEQTLQAIQQRVGFFSSNNCSAENYLQPTQSLSIRSISDIITGLKFYNIAETPLNMNLSSIYANDENKGTIKWNIPPASQGQDSINEQQVFEPSFKWLTSTFVDPNLLSVDQPQAVKIQKHKIPEDWLPVTSLLLFNVSKKIHLKSQMLNIETLIKRKFSDRYWWLKFKRAKQIIYRGKPSIILKFGDPSSAGFLYFHYASYKSNRQEFGQNCQIFRVLKDQTKQYQKQKNWVILFFRHLPLSMTKQQLLNIVNTNGCIKWMQQLIEIEGAKYTCCRVSYLDEALHVCEVFNQKKIKDAKVNIHPKSSKNWKAEEMVVEQEQERIVEEAEGLGQDNNNHVDLGRSY